MALGSRYQQTIGTFDLQDDLSELIADPHIRQSGPSVRITVVIIVVIIVATIAIAYLDVVGFEMRFFHVAMTSE